MPSEVQPKRTPISPAPVFAALRDCGMPRAGAVLVAAQIGVESGWLCCMNFNIAGAKAKPKGPTDWQFFATHEYLDDKRLAKAHELGPGLVKECGRVPSGKMKVTLFPKHPWACFRAYPSLTEAVAAHVRMLRDSFPKAWAVLAEDAPTPEAFAAALQRGVWGAYYTGDPGAYAKALAFKLRQVQDKVGDVP